MNQYKKMLLVLLAVVIFILAYGWRLGGLDDVIRLVHSDETSTCMMAMDFIEGNFALKDWFFSTGVFGAPSFELALVTKLFGFHDGLVYAVAAFNYTVLAITLFLVILNETNRLTLSLVTLCVMLPIRNEQILNATTHTLAYALSIWLLYYIAKKDYGIGRGFIWIIITSILAITNSTVVYMVVIPVVIKGFIDVVFRGKPRLFVAGVVSGALYFVFKKIWVWYRGEELGLMNATFAPEEHFWNNISVGIFNFLKLFGINIWGKPAISMATLKGVVGGIIVITIVVAHMAWIRETIHSSKEEKQPNYCTELFFCMAIVNILAYIMSTIPMYSKELSLIEPFLIGILLSTGMIINNYNYDKKKELLALCVAICFFCLNFPNFTLHREANERKEVADYLVNNNYTFGYGDYWDAASLWYESSAIITIQPVSKGAEGKLDYFELMSNKKWEEEKARFLVVGERGEMQFGITEESIRNTFGEWNEK